MPEVDLWGARRRSPLLRARIWPRAAPSNGIYATNGTSAAKSTLTTDGNRERHPHSRPIERAPRYRAVVRRPDGIRRGVQPTCAASLKGRWKVFDEIAGHQRNLAQFSRRQITRQSVKIDTQSCGIVASDWHKSGDGSSDIPVPPVAIPGLPVVLVEIFWPSVTIVWCPFRTSTT